METRSNPYYDTDALRQQLAAEAMTWLRTPVVPHGASKGGGVDCASLLGEIYVATGAMPTYPKLDYSMDAGAHSEVSLLEQELEASGCFERVWFRPESLAKRFVELTWLVRAGDCLCMSMGRSTHHAGLALGGKMIIHAIAGPGVCYGELDDSTIARRINSIWRPVRRETVAEFK